MKENSNAVLEDITGVDIPRLKTMMAQMNGQTAQEALSAEGRAFREKAWRTMEITREKLENAFSLGAGSIAV